MVTSMQVHCHLFELHIDIQNMFVKLPAFERIQGNLCKEIFKASSKRLDFSRESKWTVMDFACGMLERELCIEATQLPVPSIRTQSADIESCCVLNSCPSQRVLLKGKVSLPGYSKISPFLILLFQHARPQHEVLSQEVQKSKTLQLLCSSNNQRQVAIHKFTAS